MKRLFVFVAVVVAVVLVACRDEIKNVVELEIDHLVTDVVINSAVKSLTDDIAGNYSYVETEGITWTVCMKARHTVFQSKMGSDWNNKLYASIAASPVFDSNNFWTKPENCGGNSETYNLYRWIMETARQSLDTSEELKAAYARHKNTALESVRKNGIEKKVQDLIVEVIPYFDGSAPILTIATIRAFHNATDYGVREKIYGRLEKSGINIISDVRAWEFAERRRAEGGDELVAAYAEIFKDFVETLGTTMPKIGS